MTSKWNVEYEIPPLRAIYNAEGGPCTEEELREQIKTEQPLWRIRKITPVGPQRIQLQRKRGFNLQKISLALNGLPAVNCARPSKWSNRNKIGPGETPHYAVSCFRDDLRANPDLVAEAKRELRGKNLACYCKPGQECHVDVWLEIVNGPTPDTTQT